MRRLFSCLLCIATIVSVARSASANSEDSPFFQDPEFFIVKITLLYADGHKEVSTTSQTDWPMQDRSWRPNRSLRTIHYQQTTVTQRGNLTTKSITPGEIIFGAETATRLTAFDRHTGSGVLQVHLFSMEPQNPAEIRTGVMLNHRPAAIGFELNTTVAVTLDQSVEVPSEKFVVKTEGSVEPPIALRVCLLRVPKASAPLMPR